LVVRFSTVPAGPLVVLVVVWKVVTGGGNTGAVVVVVVVFSVVVVAPGLQPIKSMAPSVAVTLIAEARKCRMMSILLVCDRVAAN